MKSKLKLSAGILLIFISALGARAQLGGQGGIAPQQFNPATGLPVSTAPPVFDPFTGMPIAPAAPEWKDPNWKDPDITLTNVLYDNISLSEIALLMDEQFKQKFDVVFPVNTLAGMVYRGNQQVPARWNYDWGSEQIQLHLRNVTATEIFAAMNLLFENNRSPLRWELKMNGHRQIALLRVLVDPIPEETPPPIVSEPTLRRVYFVGNLIFDEKYGGMTMEQITKVITDVWQMANSPGGNIQFHKEAQLLVVTGTSSQIDFMEQTLKALGQKADQEKIDSGFTKFPSPGR